MGEEEFWRLTPLEFHALVERYHRRREWEDYRFGMLASVIANVNRDPRRRPRPFTPEEFMPSLQRPKPPRGPRDLLLVVEMLNAAFGGQDKRKGAQ